MARACYVRTVHTRTYTAKENKKSIIVHIYTCAYIYVYINRYTREGEYINISGGKNGKNSSRVLVYSYERAYVTRGKSVISELYLLPVLYSSRPSLSITESNWKRYTPAALVAAAASAAAEGGENESTRRKPSGH